MRLTISNLAWENNLEADVFAELKKRHISAIEIAPTKIWPDWRNINETSMNFFRERVSGFEVSSFQSLLFGRPELSIFGNDEIKQQTLAHLKMVADLAASLGAKPMVFGSPKNRDPGTRARAAAFAEAKEFFYTIGSYCEKIGVTLCLEANPTQYGCTFITNAWQAAELVRAVNSPGFRLHLDTACMFLAGDDIVKTIADNHDILAHFHVSEPNLGNFAKPESPHKVAAAALKKIGYLGYVSIEMLNKANTLQPITEALDYVQRTYS